ncbi:MAG: hypothetical protein LBP50_08030 [Tannerella sp.]|nr:hypothetical protein [Tannerella sp.]
MKTTDQNNSILSRSVGYIRSTCGFLHNPLQETNHDLRVMRLLRRAEGRSIWLSVSQISPDVMKAPCRNSTGEDAQIIIFISLAIINGGGGGVNPSLIQINTGLLPKYFLFLLKRHCTPARCTVRLFDGTVQNPSCLMPFAFSLKNKAIREYIHERKYAFKNRDSHEKSACYTHKTVTYSLFYGLTDSTKSITFIN